MCVCVVTPLTSAGPNSHDSIKAGVSGHTVSQLRQQPRPVGNRLGGGGERVVVRGYGGRDRRGGE